MQIKLPLRGVSKVSFRNYLEISGCSEPESFYIIRSLNNHPDRFYVYRYFIYDSDGCRVKTYCVCAKDIESDMFYDHIRPHELLDYCKLVNRELF